MAIVAIVIIVDNEDNCYDWYDKLYDCQSIIVDNCFDALFPRLASFALSVQFHVAVGKLTFLKKTT